MSNQFQVAPFCIYHYSNPLTNTYYGYIGNPTKIINLKGDIELKCISDNVGSNWILYNTFYAFNPMIRPIPNGLKLINAIKLGSSPFSTKNIEYGYDPFNIQKNSVSFLTWTQPVYNTVPLYIYLTSGGHSIPSFEKIPPRPEWTQSDISPIFVLVDPQISGITIDANGHPLEPVSKDENGTPIFKFSIQDNRCQPHSNLQTGMSLAKCFLLTDENLLGTGSGGPRTLLQQIQALDNSKKINFSNYGIIITCFIVIFLILLILYYVRYN